MPKPLVFKINDKEYPLEPVRLDRGKLYGWSEKIALDNNNEECSIAYIDETGTIVIPKGGTALGIVNSKGEWINKADLIAVNESGTPAEKLPSSFSSSIELSTTVTIEEFLDHHITSVYTLQGEENFPDFVEVIKKSPIFTFNFNYREDYEASPAFIIENKGELFVLIGKKGEFDFIGLEQVGSLAEEEEIEEIMDEEIDFSMM